MTSNINDPDLSDAEKQAIFLETYRKADGKNKTIKAVCAALNFRRSIFNSWLVDPEFEEKFFAELRAFSYSLTEELATNAAEMLEDHKEISKERYYALQIAQKSVLEVIGKLNRDRFGESQEIRLKQEGSVQPVINISLVDMTKLMPSVEVIDVPNAVKVIANEK